MRPYIEYRSRDGLSLRERNPYFGGNQPHILRRFMTPAVRMCAMIIDGELPDVREANDAREYEFRGLHEDACIYVEMPALHNQI